MGKELINKSKSATAAATAAGEEVVHQLSIGVRTRAKTQALRENKGTLHHNSAAPASEGSYLQLRNRRLQKPLNLACQTKRNPISRISNTSKSNPPTPDYSRTTTSTCSNSKVIGSLNSRSIEISKVEGLRKAEELGAEQRNINLHVGPVKASYSSSSSSFGDEKVSELEGCTTTRLISDRRTRESTPSSSSSPSPSSSSAAAAATRRRRKSRFMPTLNEMDRFFLGPEQQQQSQFMEKYNFDPVNDKPLPGRFEWKKMDP